MGQRTTKWLWTLLISVSLIGVPIAYGYARGPQWTIGRAIILSRRNAMSAVPRFYLKLSLRNTGVPGRERVRIYGRWSSGPSTGRMQSQRTTRRTAGSWRGPAIRNSPTTKGGQWVMPGTHSSAEGPAAQTMGGGTGRAFALSSALPPGIRLLGSYRREVSLNQTAILEVPLAILGAPARGTTRLEVVVMTASAITDHQFVAFGSS